MVLTTSASPHNIPASKKVVGMMFLHPKKLLDYTRRNSLYYTLLGPLLEHLLEHRTKAGVSPRSGN
jgi:hypothetical protein